MNCACGEKIELNSKFCHSCGKEQKAQVNTTNIIDGLNYGIQYQAGRDINIFSGTDTTQEKATYEITPKWRSPFTMSVLTWISFVLGITSLLPLGWSIRSISSPSLTSSVFLPLVFGFCFITAVFTFKMREVISKKLRIPVAAVDNWAVNGYSGHLTLEHIQATCPKCGGKLRYYNKLVQRSNSQQTDGSNKHQMVERKPALECVRNTEHWFVVDPAEERQTND